MYENKIAEKLVDLRNKKGVTQEDVAQSLSVSNKTVSKWENGASEPDLSRVVELAEYYGVTTDTLLGISEEKIQSTKDEICALFEGLDYNKAILKAFEIERSIVPSLYNRFVEEDDEICGAEEPFPTDASRFYRSNITHSKFFKFAVSSENVNLSVTLLKNKANFAWMNDAKKQKEIVKVFRLLSMEDALSVLYFIHSENCSKSFTADYVSRNTGVAEKRVTEILDELWSIDGCGYVTAHLTEGEAKVYECYGDGIILTLISLAFEKMCGRNYNCYSYHGTLKMIGGK